MIGIAGSNVGVGCTHFSIMLANYLTGYLRRKAILLEFNESGDFERLERYVRDRRDGKIHTGSWMRIIINMQGRRI